MKKITVIKAALVFGGVLALASCNKGGTGNSKEEQPGKDTLAALDALDEFAPIADGASLYASIDVVGSRPILDLLSFEGNTGKDAAQILDRTSRVTAAFYPKGSAQHFLASAKGNYPKTLAEFSLSVMANWKRAKPENSPAYWHSEKDALSVAFNSSRALVSDADPFAPTSAFAAPGVSVPAGFDAFRQNALMAGWLGNANASINIFLESFGVPFEIQAKQVFFSVVSANSAAAPLYNILLRIETPSGSIAVSLVQLFGVARFFTAEADGIIKMLFANAPTQDGAFLNLKIGPMNAQGIAGLFSAFSLYSKEE
jgi:hypothetical protein